MAVHLVSPWSTEASQPQLPRFGPDGQPPESSHLAAQQESSPERLYVTLLIKARANIAGPAFLLVSCIPTAQMDCVAHLL
jgi:hypothetical protein